MADFKHKHKEYDGNGQERSHKPEREWEHPQEKKQGQNKTYEPKKWHEEKEEKPWQNPTKEKRNNNW